MNNRLIQFSPNINNKTIQCEKYFYSKLRAKGNLNLYLTGFPLL